MKRILSRFTQQLNKDFPLDAEGLDALQKNVDLTAVLGNLAGDKAVLYGCEPENNGLHRRPGYLFIRTAEYPEGEVLYWEGGSTAGGMYLHKQPIAITAYGTEYPQAYVERWLVPGVGEENYKWPDFTTLTIPELRNRVETLNAKLDQFQSAPWGVVELWAGQSLPRNYLLCEGQTLKRGEYPDLFSALGTTYNNAPDSDGRPNSGTPSDSFRLPDLRGRFIVGQHTADPDYALGKAGGKKRHQLTLAEMPAHSHTVQWHALSDGGDSHAMGDGSSAATDLTSASGGDAPHENRPPYYTLAYIMRVK